MKLSHFLLAAGLCSFSAASAQTTPPAAPRGTGSAAPNAVPSGTAPTYSEPKGAVSAGEAFTKGSPDGEKRPDMKRSKNKDAMKNGKMKSKM